MRTLHKHETVRTDRGEIGTIVRFWRGWVVVLVPGMGKIVVPPQSLEKV